MLHKEVLSVSTDDEVNTNVTNSFIDLPYWDYEKSI